MKKKLLPISLLCLFGMIVAGCGGKPSSKESQPASDIPSSQPAGTSETVQPSSSATPGTTSTPAQPSSSEAPKPSSSAQPSSSEVPASSSEAPVAPTDISLDKQNASVVKGETLQLNALVVPANASNYEVTWSSEDEDVVTVSKTGLVTAVEVGTAKITAKIKNTNLKAECVISVIKNVNSITITNKDAFDSFKVGNSVSLSIAVDPEDNINALMLAGVLTVTSSDPEVAVISGLQVTALKGGTSTITASLFGKTDSFQVTVEAPVPGVPYTVAGALAKGIEEAPFNGSSGKNAAMTTTLFELKGMVIASEPNGETGYNAILDDGTEAVYLQISKGADDTPLAVGDYAKVTCKFTNYYGLLEGVSREAETGKSSAWIPADDVEVLEAPTEAITPKLNAPEAMSAAQYDAYYAVCKTNGTKNAAGATWTALKYVTIDGEYSEELVAADKGSYRVSTSYAISPVGSFKLDEPFDGQKCTFDAFLLGANTSKNKSNAFVMSQTPLAIESFVIDQEAQTIVRGNTLQLTYTTTPAGSYSRSVSWASSDDEVATVSESGLVTGIYEGSGTRSATISVTIDGHTQSVAITVLGEEIHATAVALNETSATLALGKTLQLVATTTPAQVTDVAQWSSDDTAVATVDNNGLVTAKALGDANITVRYNETAYATCAIKVAEDPRWQTEFAITDVADITLPASGDTADKYYVVCEITAITNTTYGNGNAKDKDGTEFAIYGMYNFNGKTRYDKMSADQKPVVGDIVVLYGVFTKYNNAPEIKNGWVVQRNGEVFEAPALTGISLNHQTLDLDEGSSETLTVIGTPSDAEVGTVSWSSSAEGVATVNNGTVTAVAAGTARITATVGTFTAFCDVTVVGLEPGIEKATLKYSGTTTTNMAATGNAALVGLDADLFTVDAAKGEQNNFPGLNKAGYIALYSWKNADSEGNGASFTVTIASEYVIDSIKVDYKQQKADARVYADSTLVEEADGAYAIDASSFTIKNGYQSDGSANTQVQINKVEIFYREAEAAAEEEALPWYTEGEGNQAIHFEGAGIWTWVKYGEMGYDNYNEINAAKDSFVVDYSSDPVANIVDVVVSDDIAASKICRVYITLGAAYNTGVLALTIPAKDGSKNYVGTLQFAAGELIKINGEEVENPVAQPIGGFHGVVKLIAAAGGARQPVDLTLTADSAVLLINGQDVTVTSSNWDNKDTLTLVTDGAYGTITAQFAEASNAFTVLSVSGANGAYIDTANPVVLHGNALFYDCNGTTAELQATFARRYYRSGVDANWAYDTGNADRVSSVSEPAVDGNALKLRPITAGASNRVALTLLNDFAEARPTTTIGFWVYNSAENDVTLRAWGYPTQNKASNFEYVNVDGSGSMVAKAGQWTYIIMTYYSGGAAQQKNIYNFQIADMNSTQGETLYFDNICLL